MMNSSELPKYYAVNDRPVKMIATTEGGRDVLVMNLKTGEFERDMSYGSRVHEPGQDVDQFTETGTNLRRDSVSHKDLDFSPYRVTTYRFQLPDNRSKVSRFTLLPA